MAKRYIYICQTCETTIHVEPSQAGQTINCQGCDSTQKLGTLRDIQALNPVSVAGPSLKPARDSWSATRRSLFAVGAALLAFGILLGGYMTWKYSSIQADRPVTKMGDEARQKIDQLSPAGMISRWNRIDPAAVETWAKAEYLMAREEGQKDRVYSIIGWFFAAVGLVGVVVSIVIRDSSSPSFPP